MAPGVGLVLGEVPKPILRGGKKAFRQRFQLCSCNCSGFSEKLLLERVLGEVPKPILRGGKTVCRCTSSIRELAKAIAI